MAFSRDELEQLPKRINDLFKNIQLKAVIDLYLSSEVSTICNMLIKLKTDLSSQANLATRQGQLQSARLKNQTEQEIIKLWQVIHEFGVVGKKIKKNDLNNIEHILPSIVVLSQLVTPRTSNRINLNATEFKTTQSSAPAFSPKYGELSGTQKIQSRDIKIIKQAIKDLEEKCEKYPIIINRQPSERDKTWQTTTYGKNPPPVIIRCEKDKKLLVLNLNPSDEQMMDAYVLSIKAMAKGRIHPLTIKTEGLPFDLKVALIKAAERHHIATTEKFETLSLFDYKISEDGKRFDLGNGIQSHRTEEKPVFDTPHKRS